ncbi:branched-chain amino acid ABC transporter permease [Pusillimonas sp.]|uniref:branched-chain amino acid ABC transporter permease n=1 Tax=Pusillimonas sp. TaxID=3040095 RepID=UPI0029A812D9|nr:branched-chain amino acid ABC transporter permease [Pusillimonas sp.]MDX3895355.1 branched-chain amino acid ABC transporter permease [Pusillimonas sp.]
MRFILRAILLLVLLALVLSLPSFATSYYLGLVVKIMIYALFALSLQLLVGCTGLVSLGHSAFFGIAAYFVTLLSPESGAGNMLWLLPGAVLAAMAYAVVTGALALRTKGIYFIMVTLAFAQMAYYVFHDTALGGGTDGIYLYFRPEIRLGDRLVLNIDDQFVFYVFTLVCLLLTWLFLALLMRSRFGAALTGIRVNEPRMRAAGFSTFKYKLIAYIIGCGLAGVAGFLYAVKDGYVNPELLAWEQSGLVLLMVILGGMGRLWGAIVGAVALTLLQEVFQSHALFGEFASRWHLTFGLAIIALVAALPQGLAGLPDQWRNRRRPTSIPSASAQ